MGVSRSALSHAIIGLEAKLDVRLFNRTTRSVSLTQAQALACSRASIQSSRNSIRHSIPCRRNAAPRAAHCGLMQTRAAPHSPRGGPCRAFSISIPTSSLISFPGTAVGSSISSNRASMPEYAC